MPIGTPQLCAFCNKEFMPKRNKALFCTRFCKETHRNRNKPRLTTKSVLKARELRKNRLSDTELQVIYGSMFGDGTLIKTASGYRLSFCHSEAQLDYLIWKGSLLPNLFLAYPSRYENTFHKTATVQYHLHSIHHPQLEEIHNLFYKDGRKTLTRDLLDLFSPLAFAIWYMDDGSYNTNKNSMQATWCTDSLSMDENQLMIDWFKEKHDIEIKLQFCKSIGTFGGNETYRLRINRTQVDTFFDLIRPFIHSTMLYKLK